MALSIFYFKKWFYTGGGAFFDKKYIFENKM
jgi:hypothetical protein